MKSGMLAVIVFSLAFAVSNADEVKPDEIVVTASRLEERVHDSPYVVNLFSEERIQEELMSRSLVDLFQEEPSIMVQKTGVGQGSPYIRGFTGFRTLFLIDGIRLNNSVFREGPNQYWNTIDPLTIERLEVVKGPSSVLYGSDAIGGTVNAITRSRNLYEEDFGRSGGIYFRYGSADRSTIGRVEASGNVDQRFGFLVGGGYKRYNDLTAGRRVGVQRKTGYDEQDFDAKFDFFPAPEHRITLAFQHVKQDDAWRSHATIYGKSWRGTTVGTDKKRALDQQRDLAYIQYRGYDFDSVIFDRITASLSYQRQGEEEHRIRANNRSNRQGFTVGTTGFWTQFDKESRAGTTSYGFEYYLDDVTSFSKSYLADGTLDSIGIQGPVADDATYDLVGVFVQQKIPLGERFELTPGLRFTYARADARKVEDPDTAQRMSMSQSWDNISGSLHLQYFPSENWNIFSGVSQGFRAPSLTDLTRFNISRTNEFETPSSNLRPEEFISYEIGAKANYDRWNGQIAYFYTTISDMIIRYPTGNVIDGKNQVQKANVGDGYVHGVELQASYTVAPAWRLFGGMSWQEGYADTYPTSAKIKKREPMSRIAPLTSLTGLRFEPPETRYWVETTVRMAAKQDKLPTSDKNDTDRIPPGGTPGYAVWGIRGGLRLTQHVNVSAGVENIMNADYRIHGSGQNEPGTNFVLTLNAKF